jgi:hypothetical protein
MALKRLPELEFGYGYGIYGERVRGTWFTVFGTCQALMRMWSSFFLVAAAKLKPACSCSEFMVEHVTNGKIS